MRNRAIFLFHISHKGGELHAKCNPSHFFFFIACSSRIPSQRGKRGAPECVPFEINLEKNNERI